MSKENGAEKLSNQSFKDMPASFKVDVLAEKLGISRNLGFKVAKENNLAIRVGEKRLVVLRDRVIKWLDEQ